EATPELLQQGCDVHQGSLPLVGGGRRIVLANHLQNGDTEETFVELSASGNDLRDFDLNRLAQRAFGLQSQKETLRVDLHLMQAGSGQPSDSVSQKYASNCDRGPESDPQQRAGATGRPWQTGGVGGTGSAGRS